jgi:creatinine amidohydrolase
MKWQDLTSPRFAEAVTKSDGVCIVPMGVVERHGAHLPLGTDYLTANTIAERAAAIEPAVVFPPYYFGQIHEARHQPGTIAIRCELMLQLLENVCEEISRNGLKKIVLFNGHGGNCGSLRHFVLSALDRPRDYALYLIDLQAYLPHQDPTWKALSEGRSDRHAGILETSVMLAAHPELVRLDEMSPPPRPLGRLEHLGSVGTSASWYADFPDHYAGDATPATAEKGRYAIDYMVRQVTQHLVNIKKDTATPALLKEFYARSPKPVG